MSIDSIRVLHLIATNFVGGPEKQILHHAVDLRERGWKVWIGSFRDQARRAEILDRAEACKLPICEIRSGHFDIRSVWELGDLIKKSEIQLLCTHGYKASIVGCLAKKLVGIPQIAFCRGWTAETLRVRAYEALERRFLGYADRVVCVSQAQAEKLGKRGRRVHVVHNAVLSTEISAADRSSLKQQLGFPATARLVGAVGRLSVEKGQRHLVRAAVELSQKIPEVQIVLLGEGRERESLQALIDQFGLQGIVHLPGFQQNVGTWMQALDVLANCSDTEGIPNAILEAMAVGTPVVATAVGGVPALIRDGETGLLTPPADPSSLCNALTRVLQDTKLAVQLGENGRRWVTEQFSADQQREQLIAIYRDVLDQAAGLSPATARGSISSEPNQRALRDSQLPFISVVIPVRNEEANIAGVLSALMSQNYPRDRFEVLVVDGNSTDGTRHVVESLISDYPAIRLLENPARLSSAGRNVGVRNSRGELIFFIDGHCRIPSSGLLADSARLFQTTAADCLCRPQPLEAIGDNAFQKAVACVRSSALGHGRDSTIYSTDLEGFVNPTSSGAIYRRGVFEQVGMYDEELDACEDVEFNYRVWRKGLRSYISPTLAIYYHARKTLPGLWKQMIRYGRGRYRFIRKHSNAISIAQLLPSTFVLWLVLGTVGSLWSPMLRMALLLSLAMYAGAIFAGSAALALSQGWRNLFLAPVIYPMIHVGLGAGMLAESLDATRRWLRFAQTPLAQQNSAADAPVSQNLSK